MTGGAVGCCFGSSCFAFVVFVCAFFEDFLFCSLLGNLLYLCVLKKGYFLLSVVDVCFWIFSFCVSSIFVVVFFEFSLCCCFFFSKGVCFVFVLFLV